MWTASSRGPGRRCEAPHLGIYFGGYNSNNWHFVYYLYLLSRASWHSRAGHHPAHEFCSSHAMSNRKTALNGFIKFIPQPSEQTMPLSLKEGLCGNPWLDGPIRRPHVASQKSLRSLTNPQNNPTEQHLNRYHTSFWHLFPCQLVFAGLGLLLQYWQQTMPELIPTETLRKHSVPGTSS